MASPGSRKRTPTSKAGSISPGTRSTRTTWPRKPTGVEPTRSIVRLTRAAERHRLAQAHEQAAFGNVLDPRRCAPRPRRDRDALRRDLAPEATPFTLRQQDAVLAGGLGAVEAGVGLHDQVRGRAGVVGEDRDPARDGHDRAAAREALLDPSPDALGHDESPEPRGVGQQHGELLAAVARRHVDLADPLAHHRRRPHQHAVALDVAALVVDLLEIVEIEQEQRRPQAVPLRAQHLLAQRLKEEGVVVEARQPVRHRGALGALVDRELDHLRIPELAAHVHEVVEDRDAQARIATNPCTKCIPMLDHLLPVTRGLAFSEIEMRQQIEQRGVERISLTLLALELFEQGFFVPRPRLQEFEQRLAEIESFGRALHCSWIVGSRVRGETV